MKNNEDLIKILYLIKLENCELSVRAKNCLKRAGIKNVAQILFKYNQLYLVRNLGKLTCEEIDNFLQKLSNDYGVNLISLAEQYSNNEEFVDYIENLFTEVSNESIYDIKINYDLEKYNYEQKYIQKHNAELRKIREDYKTELRKIREDYITELNKYKDRLQKEKSHNEEIIKSYFSNNITDFNEFFNQLGAYHKKLLVAYLKDTMSNEIKLEIRKEFDNYEELQKRNIDIELETYRQEQLNQIKNKTDQEIDMYIIGRLSAKVLNNTDKTGIKIDKVDNNISITYTGGGSNE